MTRSERRIAQWSLGRIARSVGGRLSTGAEVRAERVSSDTRALVGGELFVALSGENFDAHDFVGEAAKKGAVAAIVSRTEGLGLEAAGVDLPLIVVDDPLAALQALGHALWAEADADGLHTIDLTGSNGKTTVKEMLRCIWGLFGEVHATRGNLNNHIGVPLVLCDLPAECDHLILEMGANAVGDIHELIGLAPGQERIITSIGPAHLEGFGSLDGVRRGKSEIFEGSDEDETAAIVPYGEASRLDFEGYAGRIFTFGAEPGADLRASSQPAVVDGRPGQRVTLHVFGRRLVVELGLPGAHHAANLAAAVATLLVNFIDPDAAALAGALGRLELPGGRWREVEAGGYRFVDDAYNANPASMRAAIDAFCALDVAGRTKVVILGEMYEMGEEAERWHRELAADAARSGGVAAVGFVGRFAGQMAEAARSAADPERVVAGLDDVEAAARWLGDWPEAVVLLKGSRGARLERIIERVEVA